MIDLSRRAVLCASVALLISSLGLVAQLVPAPAAQGATDSGKLHEYEVVSVKENKSGDGTIRMMSTPDGFNTTNIDLKNLIADAYGVRIDLISGGPGWIDSKGFDVEAKVAGPDIEAYKRLDDKDRMAMMRAFLKERFNLRTHIESKEMQVYDLVVAKGGAKLKEAPPDPPHSDTPEVPEPDAKSAQGTRRNGMINMRTGNLSGTGIPLQQVADALSYALHRPIRDKTGLDGKYDIELKWTPDGKNAKPDDGSTDTPPSIFTAVQEQLGLKLQSTRGPVDTLVIDQVVLPSEN